MCNKKEQSSGRFCTCVQTTFVISESIVAHNVHIARNFNSNLYEQFVFLSATLHEPVIIGSLDQIKSGYTMTFGADRCSGHCSLRTWGVGGKKKIHAVSPSLGDAG